MFAKKTLEINPRHSLIVALSERIGEDSQETRDLAELIYDAALVQSGFTMEDSNDFASRIHRIIGAGLGADPKGIYRTTDTTTTTNTATTNTATTTNTTTTSTTTNITTNVLLL